MTVPMAKVRSLCTTSEVALVRASRKGELERLDHAQVKRLAVRARKLFDKWQHLGHSESRARSRQVGVGGAEANTLLKVRIFREALDSFEARLSALQATPASSAKKPTLKTKKDWIAQHRSGRAAIRKRMNAVENLVNAQSRKEKKPAANSTAKTRSPVEQVVKPVPPAPKPKSAMPKTFPPTKAFAAPARSTKGASFASAGSSKSTQREANRAIKRSRIVHSGKTTRFRGHITSRGKRAQARRDSR